MTNPTLDIHYKTLVRIAEKYTQNDGKTEIDIAGIGFYRHSTSVCALPCIQPLGIVLALQGSKTIRFNNRKIDYRVGDILFAGADLSGFSYNIQCSPEKPFLGISIEFDLAMLSELCAELESVHDVPPAGDVFCTIPADAALLECIIRLVSIPNDPPLSISLQRLARKELALRLLHTNSGLRHLLQHHSAAKILRIMNWLKEHCAERIHIDRLAEQAHMSPSSFRQHFRAVAGISPLQYHKQLKLQQARSLIVNRRFSASQAAAAVGYASVSQFSREYSRFFGTGPLHDKKSRDAV